MPCALEGIQQKLHLAQTAITKQIHDFEIWPSSSIPKVIPNQM
jgi:hypothetical protein